MSFEPLYLVAISLILFILFYLFNRRLKKRLAVSKDQSRELLEKAVRFKPLTMDELVAIVDLQIDHQRSRR